MAVFCGKCGAQLEGNERFCVKCGHDVTAAGAVPAAAPTPVAAAPPPPLAPPPQGYAAPPPPGYGAPGPIPVMGVPPPAPPKKNNMMWAVIAIAAAAGGWYYYHNNQQTQTPANNPPQPVAGPTQPGGGTGWWRWRSCATSSPRAAGRSRTGRTERGAGSGAAVVQHGSAGQWAGPGAEREMGERVERRHSDCGARVRPIQRGASGYRAKSNQFDAE